MGPAARKPSNEAKTKKDIEAFINEENAIFARRDWDAMANRVDYPVFMLTDTLVGATEGELTSREAYLASMKPFWENSPPGATKHKLTIGVLSDTLASVVDDYEMTMGKQKVKARNASLLVRSGGGWKYKVMSEAGWGGMKGNQGSAPAAAPAPTAAPVPAPAPAPVNNAPPPPPGKGPPPPPAPVKK